jgi:phosphopantetheinyl transferase
MSLFQKNMSVQAEMGPILIPTLLSPVFYSPWGDPAWVASMPLAVPASRQGREGAGHCQAAKESLARFLAEYVLERQVPEMILDSDYLGKPRIWLGKAPGPALSFSWSAGRLWAAAGGSESGLGLDAAAPGDFFGSYPHQRVFLAAEWQMAVTLTARDCAEAAALLWSVKEAVVKATGCGFHFVSPRQIRVHFAARREDGYLWRVSLENPDRDGDLPGGREPCLAVSVRLKEVWLSLAWRR